MYRFGLGIRRVIAQVVQAAFEPNPAVTVIQNASRQKRVTHDLEIEFENTSPVYITESTLLVETQDEGQVLIVHGTGAVIG